MSLIVYTSKSMSGRTGRDLVIESMLFNTTLESYGITVLDPVEIEGIKPLDAYLFAKKSDMDIFWKRDKECIRDAHVVFDVTPHRQSEGRCHENGLARYCYFKPVVRIFPKDKMPVEGNVAYYEDDLVVSSLEEACQRAVELWGTYPKRLKWRLRMLFRSMPKWVTFQVRFLFQ